MERYLNHFLKRLVMKDPGIFYSLVVIALLISCGTKPPHENEKEIKKAKLVENFNDYRGSDLFNFTEVSIGNDQIQMIIITLEHSFSQKLQSVL